jgi:RHS repeat-associated protein
MSEVIPPSRRRGHGRTARSTGPTLAPLPRLAVPWSPLEVLAGEQVERILVAAFRVLEEAGLEIRSPAAREVLRQAGALVEETANYAFGRPRTSYKPGPVLPEPYGFTQKERDKESGLHYFEARYLTASVNRFASSLSALTIAERREDGARGENRARSAVHANISRSPSAESNIPAGR